MAKHVATSNTDVNLGFSKFDATNNDVIGEKLHIFLLDLQGNFRYMQNTIKIYRPGSLYVVEEWDNEGKNLNLPCRFFPKAEYCLFPSTRKFEGMTSDVRMFGRDFEKLQNSWKKSWLNFSERCNKLAEKFLYISDFTNNME